MSRIVRLRGLPAPIEVKINGEPHQLGGSHGALGQTHPTLADVVWVDWLPPSTSRPGYYRRRDLIEVGTAFVA